MSGSSNPLLLGLLAVAVPNRAEVVRQWDQDRRKKVMLEASATLSGPGAEDLIFGGKRTREMFGVLVDALACGSCTPGGIPFDGVVFCAAHGVTCGYPCRQCLSEEVISG